MSLVELWTSITQAAGLENVRPDYSFDPDFYSHRYPDIRCSEIDPHTHFENHGRQENRKPNAYRAMYDAVPDLHQRLAKIVTHRKLREEINSGREGIFELVFELIALGDPVDRMISDFSERHYFRTYSDLEKAGVSGFQHYILHGIEERRRTLRDVRQNQFEGKQLFDPGKPTCLVCVHECSKTGAPIVGLDLAREAAESHNVVVMALRGGPLLEGFRECATSVVISESPDQDIDYFDLPSLGGFEFAIVNSVESFPFVPVLVRHSVPFASYLHEFSDYTHPAYKFVALALLSDLMVFSSSSVRDSWAQIFADLDFDIRRDTVVVPQAELRPDKISRTALDDSRKRLTRLIGADCADRKVVYGAGHAQWRKGTDLFVLAAQVARRKDPEALFVWIGDGLNHEDHQFGVWLDKHMREAGANSPGGNLHFLPAGDYYSDVCNAADVLFLPSRLDPLPNVVFDAVRASCKVVLFENATGFDDQSYSGDAGLISVPFGDIDAACDALLGVPRKRPAFLGRKLLRKPQVGAAVFQRISKALKDRLASRNYFVAGGGDYDVPVVFSEAERDRAVRIAEREKIWTYKRRFVWRSRKEAEAELAASDNWMHQNSRIERFAWVNRMSIPYSVHIHAHYLDNLGGDLLYYRALREASRLVITTDTPDKADRIHRIAGDAGAEVETLVVPNRGRDILPFLDLFSSGQAGRGEIWCHVHQKKSVGTSANGETWRRFLMAILMGDDKRLSSAIEAIGDQNTGLVTAFDPYIVDWAGSRRLLNQIAHKLPGPVPKHVLAFPVGNMFWAKGPVVEQMNGLFDADYPWPNEPIANDGTVYHLIERLWPAASVMAGLEAVFLDKPDQRRA